MPLASKLILPEDTTVAALEISNTAGVFDQGNEAVIRKLHDVEEGKRERLLYAEREAVEEFAKAKKALQAEAEMSEPSPKKKPYSLVDYDSDSRCVLLSCGLSMSVYLFALFFSIRVFYGLLQITYFVPDEVWQGPEIGHLLAFGRGYATWEWWVGLRSYLHPLMFAALFKGLVLFNLDYNFVMITSPRVLQAAIAAVGDLAFHKISRHLHTAPWATVFHLTNWCSVFMFSRTVVNSTEVSMVLLGVLCFMENRSILLATISGLSFAVRPTSVLFFLPVCIAVALKGNKRVTLACIAVGCSIIAIASAVDSLVYGRFVFPAFNFVRYNLGLGIAENYGTHDWHFYFTIGLGSYFMGALLQVVRNIQTLPSPVLAGCGLSIAILSLSRHKELRFAVPAFVVLSTVINHRPRLMILHVVLALFFSRFQGVAPELIMENVRTLASDTREFSTLFLGCHTTPWTTHLHDKPQVSLDFIECAPTQVTGKLMSDHKLFSLDPVDWLRKNSQRVLRSDLIVLDSNDAVEAELASLGFIELRQIWDGFFGDTEANEWTFLGNKYFVLMIRKTD